MSQIAFGVTSGPNGPQMTTMIIPSSSAPSSYDSHFVTPEGINVGVTFNTDNKAIADRLEDEIAQKMGWKILEEAPEGPETLGSKITTAWLLAVLIPVVVGVLAFFGALLLNMGNYIEFRTIDDVIKYCVRGGLWSFPLIGCVGTIVALITHKTEKVAQPAAGIS